MKELKLGLKSSYDLLHICNKIFHHWEVSLCDISEMNVEICGNLNLLLFPKNVLKSHEFLLVLVGWVFLFGWLFGFVVFSCGSCGRVGNGVKMRPVKIYCFSFYAYVKGS